MRKMDKKRLSYKIRKYIDVGLPIFFAVGALVYLIQSVLAVLLSGDLFVAIRLWGVGVMVQSTTVVNVSLLYLVNYFVFRTFLPGNLRVVRALLFTVLGGMVYGLVQAVCSVSVVGWSVVVLPLLSVLVVVLIMFNVNRETRMLRVNLRLVVPVLAVYVASLLWVVCGGVLVVESWQWVVHKSVLFWVWLVFANR